MATRTVEEAFVVLFRDDFGFSEGESSGEEEGCSLSTYLGAPVVLHSELYELTRRFVEEEDADSVEDDFDPILGSADVEDPLTGTAIDEVIAVAQMWPYASLLRVTTRSAVFREVRAHFSCN